MTSPVVFTNLLPFRVKVYLRQNDKLSLLGSLGGAGSIMTVKLSTANPKDEIHVTYSPDGDTGPTYEILEPITLTQDVREIRIGDVVYEDKTNTLVQRSHSDISGIRFHNRTTIPIDIYISHSGYQPKLVAML